MSRRIIRKQRGIDSPLGLSIAQENALPGNASGWAITGAGDSGNVGFVRQFSVNAGETAEFSCHGGGSVIDIYRIGWYGGAGWRLVTTLTNAPTTQPAAVIIPDSNGAQTCTSWSVTAIWSVPADATSGLYVGVYRNAAQNNAFHIPFIVRRDDRSADIMYKTSDTTWALAYNHYGTQANPLNGGRSLYGTYAGGSPDYDKQTRGLAATYHRPIVTRAAHPSTYWLNCEAPLIRYLERNGFNITYSASKDWRVSVTIPDLAECNVYISSGHDEYWSVGMRSRWEALRDAGKHLLFMSGNEVFWRTRFDDELGGSGNGDTMWCFKDTMDGPGAHISPNALDPVTWTGTWKDTRAPNNATRASEWELTGTDFRMNGINYRTFSMSAADAICDHVFWRGTTATSAGVSVAEIIGFEADEMRPLQPINSRSVLAATTVNIDGARADNNGEYYSDAGNLTWGVVAQRYASGALVGGFGTPQWSWGLDATHDLGSNRANVQMQQATLNLLRDLGAVPDTPMAGLSVPAPVSLDNYGVIP